MTEQTATNERPLPERPRGAWVMGDPVESPDQAPRSNPLGLVLLAGLLAWLWIGAGPRAFLFVIGLIIMIFLHELGHFMTARWTGMKATQFFLGMGPRLWSTQRGEVEYGIRAIPAGAFVRIVGMNNLDPAEPADEARAYKNQAYWKRMVVITAGSMMHFIQAFVLFVVVASVIGRLALPAGEWTIGTISRLETGETPAVVAGLEPGDTILAIDGADTTTWNALRAAVADRAGDEVTLDIRKADGTLTSSTIELASITDDTGAERGFIGVGPELDRVREGPLAGVGDFAEVFWGTIKVVPQFISPATFAELGRSMFAGGEDVEPGEVSDRPISMVGAVQIAGQSDLDWAAPIEILALINVSVGLINLLPLLPLDGGHAAIATYERLRSRRGRRYEVDVAKLLPVTYAVVALLSFLMLSTVWLDIVDPIG